MVALSQLKEVDGISSIEPEEISHMETITEDISSREVSETLNVLVDDGSNVGACMLDLVAPPKLFRR